MKWLDLTIIFVFFIFSIIIVGKYAYDNGVYDGMKDLCKEELLIDKETEEVYCGEITANTPEYNYLYMGDIE